MAIRRKSLDSYAGLRDMAARDDSVLARYVTGSASAMGQRNDIDLDNKYIVLDTSGMPDDLLLPGIFWATDVANDLIMDAGGDLSALIADELWSLVGANSNPLAAGFVQELVKTIRGLGGIAVTSTQGMQDLFGLDGGKYGKVTISVTNNQMPLMPLFSPVYTSTRPYSQTRSNTQRELMQPDEILRLDRSQCIALFQGHKPALLYKLAPEELPDYGSLKSRRVVKYIPKWKRREQQAQKKKAASKQAKPPEPTPKEPPPAKEEVNPAQDLEYSVEDTKQETAGGIGLIDLGDVVGDDEPNEEADSPPGR